MPRPWYSRDLLHVFLLLRYALYLPSITTIPMYVLLQSYGARHCSDFLPEQVGAYPVPRGGQAFLFPAVIIVLLLLLLLPRQWS